MYNREALEFLKTNLCERSFQFSDFMGYDHLRSDQYQTIMCQIEELKFSRELHCRQFSGNILF